MLDAPWVCPFERIQPLNLGYVWNIEVPAGHDDSIEPLFPPLILAPDVTVSAQHEPPLVANLLCQLDAGVVGHQLFVVIAEHQRFNVATDHRMASEGGVVAVLRD